MSELLNSLELWRDWRRVNSKVGLDPCYETIYKRKRGEDGKNRNCSREHLSPLMIPWNFLSWDCNEGLFCLLRTSYEANQDLRNCFISPYETEKFLFTKLYVVPSTFLWKIKTWLASMHNLFPAISLSLHCSCGDKVELQFWMRCLLWGNEQWSVLSA